MYLALRLPLCPGIEQTETNVDADLKASDAKTEVSIEQGFSTLVPKLS